MVDFDLHLKETEFSLHKIQYIFQEMHTKFKSYHRKAHYQLNIRSNEFTKKLKKALPSLQKTNYKTYYFLQKLVTPGQRDKNKQKHA